MIDEIEIIYDSILSFGSQTMLLHNCAVQLENVERDKTGATQNLIPTTPNHIWGHANKLNHSHMHHIQHKQMHHLPEHTQKNKMYTPYTADTAISICGREVAFGIPSLELARLPACGPHYHPVRPMTSHPSGRGGAPCVHVMYSTNNP